MITTALSVIIFLVSMQGFQNYNFFEKFKHSPYLVYHNKEYYRLLTSGFLHGSWGHLLVNLLVFWQYGSFVEENIFLGIFGRGIGDVLYILLFILSIIAANLHSTYRFRNSYNYASIGASGAVSAILFSYLLVNPWSKLYLYFVIPIYTIVAAVIYLIYSQWASRNSNDHIDHSAHFYGAVFGFLFTIAVKPSIFLYFIDRLVNDFPLK